MAGEDLGVVGQAEQPLLDARAERLVVASGEVGAPNAAAEKRVAGEDPAFHLGIEADAAFGVAWRADDLKRAVTHLDDLAIVQPAVGKLAFALERNTEQQRLLFRALEIGFHVGMCRHFDAVFLLDSRIAYDVVEMAVRVDGQNGFEAMAVDETKELVFGTDCITAWVDDDAVLGVGVVNDVSVFREGVENELFYIEHNDVFRGKDNAFWEALRDFAYLCGLIFDTDVVKNEIHAPVSIALRRGTHSPWPVLQRHEHAFREEPRAVERLPLVVLSERQF